MHIETIQTFSVGETHPFALLFQKETRFSSLHFRILLNYVLYSRARMNENSSERLREMRSCSRRLLECSRQPSGVECVA
jgi:hypothetical protein